jgi:hypothetical protein
MLRVQSSGVQGSGFKGWFPGTLTNEINGKEKKREAINPEPGTFEPDRPDGQLYLMNSEV